MTVERYLMEALKTAPVYVEDVFSTYIYKGTAATQTITNNIDLSTNGGLVWAKSRSSSSSFQGYHFLSDTARGTGGNVLSTNTTGGTSGLAFIDSFNTTGFTINSGSYMNVSSDSLVSWTFRKQPKFFDIVTYTGDGVAGRQISHSLNASPGFIITKATNTSSNWLCYHTSLGFGAGTDTDTNYIVLNSTAASNGFGTAGVIVSANTTSFTPGASANANGLNYVAYLFATSNSGGFGLSGSDSVVACNSFTTDGSGNATVSLGWEPQFVLVKCSSTADNWFILDTMRGFSMTQANLLVPNTSAAENNLSSTPSYLYPSATGFSTGSAGLLGASQSYIYVAIRRGPMKVPTSGTSVFSPKAVTGGSIYDVTFDNSLIPDLIISQKDLATGGTYNYHMFNDRLRGLPQDMSGSTYVNNPGLSPASLDAENTGQQPNTSNWLSGSYNSRAVWGGGWSGYSGIFYGLKRAPGFMDEVCYTGTGVATTQAHNLRVVPELMIVKNRSNTNNNWCVYSQPTGNTQYLYLNTTDAAATFAVWNNTSPTASVFSLGSVGYQFNGLGNTYVAYLFATCPGVSKVGSYTGTGAAQNIDCGFAAGARFILIKRTDSTGDWYTYDSAQGISSGNDPYVLMNTSGAQVTGTNYIGTYSSGFALTSSAPAALNANGGSFIFLAIA